MSIDDKKMKHYFLNLLEGSFIAIHRGQLHLYQELIEGAEQIDPSNVMIAIAKGYQALHQLDLGRSREWFLSALATDPNNSLASSLLSLSYVLDPKNRETGQKLIHSLLEEQKEEKEVNSLLNSILDCSFTLTNQDPQDIQRKDYDKSDKSYLQSLGFDL